MGASQSDSGQDSPPPPPGGGGLLVRPGNQVDCESQGGRLIEARDSQGGTRTTATTHIGSRPIAGAYQYRIGERVEYSSASLGAWIEARVERVHADGTVDLDCRERADPLRIRPLLVSPDSQGSTTRSGEAGRELERLVGRTVPLVEQVRQMERVVHELTQSVSQPRPSELQAMERKGRAVLSRLRGCCRELEAFPVTVHSLRSMRDEALSISRSAMHSAEALGAALGAELSEDAQDGQNTQRHRPRSSPSDRDAVLRDSSGAVYRVGDTVQFSSDSRRVWVPARISAIRSDSMDLFVETSPRGGGRGGSGQQQPELEHYPHVSPHKVRRESHRYAQLPKSPVPRGAVTADESMLRRITTNGGTVYETGNRVELSSGADEEWLPATIAGITPRGRPRIALDDGSVVEVPTHKLRHMAAHIARERALRGEAEREIERRRRDDEQCEAEIRAVRAQALQEAQALQRQADALQAEAESLARSRRNWSPPQQAATAEDDDPDAAGFEVGQRVNYASRSTGRVVRAVVVRLHRDGSVTIDREDVGEHKLQISELYLLTPRCRGADGGGYRDIELDKRILMAYYREYQPSLARESKVGDIISKFRRTYAPAEWREMMYASIAAKRDIDPREFWEANAAVGMPQAQAQAQAQRGDRRHRAVDVGHNATSHFTGHSADRVDVMEFEVPRGNRMMPTPRRR